MSICNLTWYQPKVRRIMKDVRALKRRQIAEVKHITSQGVSKGLDKYEKDLTEWIQILDMAGYEIREKE